jgi:hypothetical protein
MFIVLGACHLRKQHAFSCETYLNLIYMEMKDLIDIFSGTVCVIAFLVLMYVFIQIAYA